MLPILGLLLAFTAPVQSPRLYAHYMPWFQSKPFRGNWGWHWTMNKFQPDQAVNGLPDIASHYHPLIGPYDSADPDLIEYHVQLMKLAGIDGAFIDWYGNQDCYDYLDNHRASLELVDKLTKAGLGFSVVYEDRTVPNLIKHGNFPESESEQAGNQLFHWLESNWFSQANYAQINHRPLLLNFGPEYYKGEAWNRLFEGLKTRPYYVSLDSKQGVADSTFGWPQPREGKWRSSLDSYYARVKGTENQIAPAFPRFNDYYGVAGAQPTLGVIPDDSGKTFTETLSEAFQSGTPIIQLITWNDWGEGTIIEPSVEFGYRDLEAVQHFRKTHLDPKFKFTANDLRLPAQLYLLRKQHPGASIYPKISELLLAGKPEEARKLLAKI